MDVEQRARERLGEQLGPLEVGAIVSGAGDLFVAESAAVKAIIAALTLSDKFEAQAHAAIEAAQIAQRRADRSALTPPQGYVAAPEDPSLAMTAAGQLFGLTANQACAVYQSMLAASPEVKP